MPSSSVPAHASVARRPRRGCGARPRHARQRAARGDEAERDVVAGRHVVDALPDRLDHAGALVAEHDRHAAVAQVPLGQVQVGVAHARGGDPDEHLARRRGGSSSTSSTESGVL